MHSPDGRLEDIGLLATIKVYYPKAGNPQENG